MKFPLGQQSVTSCKVPFAHDALWATKSFPILSQCDGAFKPSVRRAVALSDSRFNSLFRTILCSFPETLWELQLAAFNLISTIVAVYRFTMNTEVQNESQLTLLIDNWILVENENANPSYLLNCCPELTLYLFFTFVNSCSDQNLLALQKSNDNIFILTLTDWPSGVQWETSAKIMVFSWL